MVKSCFSEYLFTLLAIVQKAVGADFGDIALIMIGSYNTTCMCTSLQDAKTVAGIFQPSFMSNGKSGKAST